MAHESKYSSFRQNKPYMNSYLFDGLFGLIGSLMSDNTQSNINSKNLTYQRERNAIEDARYEDETAYNRAFAEDERTYQRALQQEIFNREDTAMARQAADLASIGINPLSFNMSGANAGQAVSGAGEPTLSARGGQALHDDYNAWNKHQGIMQALSAGTNTLLGLADTFNGIETGKYQRDSLALQNDAQFLDNLAKANSLGIQYDGLFKHYKNKSYRFDSKSNAPITFSDEDGVSLFDTDYFRNSLGSKFKKDYLDNMPEWVKTLNAVTDDGVYNNAEKALTKASDLFDNFTTNIFENNMDSFKDKNGKFNLFKFLQSLL